MLSRLLTTEGRANFSGARSQGHVSGVTDTGVLASLQAGKILNVTPPLRQGHWSRGEPVRKQGRLLSQHKTHHRSSEPATQSKAPWVCPWTAVHLPESLLEVLSSSQASGQKLRAVLCAAESVFNLEKPWPMI